MKKKYINFNNWQKLCNYTFFYLFTGVVLMAVFQIFVIITYGDWEIFQELSKIIKSFWFATRGSAKLFAVIWAPFFLCGLFFLIIPFPFLLKYFLRILPVLGWLFLWIALVISLVNFYYYKFYSGPIDIFIFEGQKESLADLFYYIQGGISLFQVCLILGLGSILLYFLNQKIILLSTPCWNIKNRFSQTGYVIVSLLFFIIVARGTLHPSIVFRLARDEKVTNNLLLNNAAVNGVNSLYQAYIDKKLHEKQWINFSPISDEQALVALQTLHPKQKISLQVLKEKTELSDNSIPINTKKPHIVLSLMESWGSYQMRFHDKNKLNLLGALEPHLKEDYYFENLFAVSGHTYAAIQFLLTNYWGINLIDANYQGDFKSNLSLLKKIGYRPIFVTSGKKSWHKLDESTKDFGFEESYGWYDILDKYPEAPNNFYGGYDHTTFEFVLEKIKTQSNQPLFFFVLTTSNHTPYFIPPNYNPLPITNIPPKMQKIIETNPKKTKKILTTYQYANHSLGNFIAKIKTDSNLKENTVIVALGDHYSRRLFNKSKDESVLYGYNLIPAYFYFPTNYRKNFFFDKQRLGSQGDIFPTIMATLFLPNNYFISGNNLLAKEYPKNLAMSNNSVMSKYGFVSNTSKPTYYSWEDKILGNLQRLEKPTAELQTTLEIQKTYHQLLSWYFFKK